MNVLFSSGSDIQLLKWEGTTESPIMVAADIAYNEEAIGQFYSGMKMQGDKNRMIGYSQILTSDPFWKIKRNNKLFKWLQMNKVWVKPTILLSSKHVTNGWLLCSHPSYTNYARVTTYLLQRIGVNGADPELSPYSLLCTTADKQVLQTRVLKVVTTKKNIKTILEHIETIMDGLVAALTGDVPDEFSDSRTAAFKVTPFQNMTINRAGIAKSIERQSNFLHHKTTTSVVDMGTGNKLFLAEEDDKELQRAEGTIHIWAMVAKTDVENSSSIQSN